MKGQSATVGVRTVEPTCKLVKFVSQSICVWTTLQRRSFSTGGSLHGDSSRVGKGPRRSHLQGRSRCRAESRRNPIFAREKLRNHVQGSGPDSLLLPRTSLSGIKFSLRRKPLKN